MTTRHRQATSTRINRKARRAAKMQPEVPAVAAAPAPALVSGPGYGRYVGRVGALAVALGLGAAVATGYGLGIPAVASAENGSESTENTPNDPPSPQDPPAEPGGNGSGSGTGAGSSGPTVPEMQLPEHSGSQQPSNTSSPSEMQVSVSGGAQLTGSGAQNGSGSGTTQTPTTHSQTPTPSPTQEPLVNNGIPSGGTTPTTSQTESGYVAPTGTTTPAAPQGNPNPNVIPNQSGHVTPLLTGTTTTTVIHNNGETNQPGNGAARLSGGQPNLQTFSTAAGTSFTSQLSVATASGTPAPAALVDQPDNPIEALMGAPAALANIAATAISMFFNGLLNPGPGTPAPPVMLFVVLGWAQRELARTFFNQSPNGVADNIGTNEDTGVTIPVLSNDTDGDLGAGDVLTVTDYTQPANGSVALNPNGTFTYTPDANFNGTDTFTYTVSDEASPWHLHGLGGFFGGGAHAAAPTTVTITVGSVNDAPVAVDDSFTTDEDHPLTGNPNVHLAGNDTDVDGDTLTAVSFTQPTNGGAVANNGDGTWTYTPGANAQALDDGESLQDSFTYTVSDGHGGTDIGTVNITVNGVNDAPAAVDDAFTTDEDHSLTGDPNFYLAGNDTDVDLENLTAVSFTQPTNGGSVTNNGDGTWTYTPGTNAQTLGAGESFDDTFTYEVSDGTTTDTGLVTITVTGINDAPNAVDDLANTDEDTATTGNVLTNDTDIDGGPLQVTTATPMNGTYGTVTINPDGSYTYTPYNGSAPGQGTTVGATGGTITLNDPSQVTQGDNTFGGHDYVAVVFTPSATGTYEFGQTGALVDTMIYVFGGATFDPSAPGTLLDFNDDSGTADTCGTQGFCPRVDPTLTAGQPVTIVITTYSAGAVLGLPQNLYTNGPGTFAGSAAGADALAEGETGTDTFTYEVSDGNGGTDTATLTVTITGTNDAPVAADDVNATDEETPVTGNVLTNDTDIDNGDVLTVTTTTPMTGNYGTVTIGTDGSYTYTPGPNAQTLAAGETATDTFTYTVTDTHGAFDNATLAVTVTGLNDAPVAVDDAFSVGEDGALTGDPNVYLAANDTDIDGDTLTVVGFTPPTNGGSVVDNGDGTWTYTPGANAQALGNGDSLQDTFTYTVTDGNGGSDIGTVTITVTGANDTPVAAEDTATTNEDSAVNVNVLANDSDIDGDILTVVSFTQPDNGGAVIDNGDGTFTYTPGANAQALGAGASLDDTFTYTVSDGNGGNATGTVTITVTGSNDAPVAVDDAFSTGEDSPPLTFNLTNLLSNDTDAENDSLTPYVGSLTQPAHGSLVFDSGTGTFTYTPSAAAQGLDDGETFTDTFSYTILDGNGGFNTATVTITINGANDAPVAVDDVFSTDEDHSLTGDATAYLASNDNDVDGEPLTAISFTQPTNGGTVVDNGDGTWTYIPGANAQELGAGQTLQDTFTYEVSDGTATDTGLVTITVTVTGINDAPNAVNDLDDTDEDTATTGNVLTNDTDVDGGPLTVTTTTPMNGTYGTVTINADGSYTFTPYNGGAPGQGTVVGASGGTITLNDPTQVTQGTVDNYAYNATSNFSGTRDYIAFVFTPSETQSYLFGQPSGPIDTMLALYNGPFDPTSTLTNRIAFNDDSGGGTCGGYSCPQVTANLTAGQPITIVITTFGANVPLGLPQSLYTTGPGTFTGNSAEADALAEGQTGTDTFTYEVSDGNGGTDTATLTVTITGTNDAPVATDDVNATNEETPVSGNVLTNDTDVDNGDVLTVTTTTPMTGNYGTVTIGTDGSYTYTPGTAAQGLAAGETATETFTYSITDTHGATDSANLMITLTGINDAPVANPDAFGTDEDHPLNGDPNTFLGVNDTDVDGDTLTVVSFTPPTNGGSVVANSDGTWTYTPNAEDLDDNEFRTDTFTYLVSDGIATAQGIVTITIAGRNDAPIATADVNNTNEETSVMGDVLTNDTDVDIEALSVTTNNPMTGNYGSVTIGSDGSYTYTPGPVAQTLAAGQEVDDVFTYTVTDGTASTTSTLTVTIVGLDDAPTLTASPGNTTFTENDAPVAIDGGISLTDIDTPTMVAAIITINNPEAGDTLNWTEPINSNIHIQSNNGTSIVLIGNASQIEYQAALQSITFESPGDDPVAGNRSINITIITPDAQNTVAKTVTVVAVDDGPAVFDPAFNLYNVGNSPYDVAIYGSHLYASNSDGTVTVVDLGTNTQIDTDSGTAGIQGIPVGSLPFGMQVVGYRLFVVNRYSDSVSVIDLTDDTAIDTDTSTLGVQPIAVGNEPSYAVAVGNRLYVGNEFDDTVTVVDIDPASATRYQVIDVDSNSSGVQNIQVGNGPYAMAATGDRVFAINFSGSTVSVIDASTNTVVQTMSGNGLYQPHGAAASDNYLYVGNDNGTVSVFDLDDYSAVGTPIATGSGGRISDMVVSGDYLYLAHTDANQVVVINTVTNTVVDNDLNTPGVQNIAVGSAPWGITVNGTHIYVTNLYDGTVSVVQTQV